MFFGKVCPQYYKFDKTHKSWFFNGFLKNRNLQLSVLKNMAFQKYCATLARTRHTHDVLMHRPCFSKLLYQTRKQVFCHAWCKLISLLEQINPFLKKQQTMYMHVYVYFNFLNRGSCLFLKKTLWTVSTKWGLCLTYWQVFIFSPDYLIGIMGIKCDNVKRWTWKHYKCIFWNYYILQLKTV